MNINELKRIMEKSVEGSEVFRDDIRYAPAMLVTRSEDGKLEFVRPETERLWTAPELNPAHLRKQGIESRIDERTRNVVYSIPGEGNIRVGFYDRKTLERDNQK